MVTASTWRPRQPSSEGANATDQTSIAAATRTLGPAREMDGRMGDVASLLLLPAGDVETNPGPSCYECGQNFHQSDTPLTFHTPDCVIRTHKQTRCSGVPRSQQSLPWHCSTHGCPEPPVTTQTSHAGHSCHHPFRPGTRPLACLAQGYMNLAHAARRCSGHTAPPPDQWRCLHHCNITETVAGVSASALGLREPLDCCQHPAVRLQRLRHRLPPHLLRPLPRRSQHSYQHRPLVVPSVPCHCCTCTLLTSYKALRFGTKTPPTSTDTTNPAVERRRSPNKTA